MQPAGASIREREREREREHQFAASIGLGFGGHQGTGASPMMLDRQSRGQARFFLATAPAQHWVSAPVFGFGLRS